MALHCTVLSPPTQVRNSPNLVAEAQLTVKVTDENNLAPFFRQITSGSVLENEPPGTALMKVSAIDNDGTYPNNKITYSIDPTSNMADKFSINPDTGDITTKMEFDREEKQYYALTVIASDGAPSSVGPSDGEPNRTPHTFRIAIIDKNDNPPYFPQQHYTADIYEDQDVGSKVIEVKAEDKDSEASLTTYSIKDGNLNMTFRIEEQTGYILSLIHI